MRIVLAVMFFAYLFTGPGFSQTEPVTGDYTYENPPRYFEELLDFSSGNKSTTRVDIFIQLPYPSVQFVAGNNKFHAIYTITLSILDEDKAKLIEEKTWSSKLEVKNFNETVSKKNYTLNMKSFYLKPGNYVLRTSVYDKESNREMPLEKKFTVRNLSGNFALSDIMLLSKLDEEKGKSKISPNVSQNVAYMEKGLPIFYELYSDNPRTVSLVYEIYNQKKETVFSDTAKKNLDTGKTQMFYILKDSSFSMGYYTLELTALDTAGKELASVKSAFYSRWIGMPVSITDLDKAVDELVYIASSSEISKMKNAKTSKEKSDLFKAFWKKLDPTPSTQENEVFDEYYRRIAYANAHFSRYFAGWQSDMGMVFVLLGPPDSIDRHPFEIDSKPYVVWSYYELNRNFIFIDDTGFGDYRLITPFTGDLYKFRM